MHITSKEYACKECGHITQQSTNHYGNTWNVGKYNRCPKCPPIPPNPDAPQLVQYRTTWVCQEKPGEPINWIKLCRETSVHYGYVGEEKRFYIFHDKDRPAIFGQWVLKRADTNTETMHTTLDNAQSAATKMVENEQ